MKKIFSFVMLALLSTHISHASVNPKLDMNLPLMKDYLAANSSPKELQVLREKTLKEGTKAVPTLIEVMKRSNFDERKRWMATFLLGRIMGDKSVPFISKFTGHPNPILRVAGLKTLLNLKVKDQAAILSKTLDDDALLVRTQSLENIRALKLTDLKEEVWQMMFDKKNYLLNGKTGERKRGQILKEVIITVGELNYKAVQPGLLKLSQSNQYDDVFNEVNTSLEKITGKKSPRGDIKAKRAFWAKI